jgi:hypothetical protein
MRQTSGTRKSPGEKIVKEIKRAMRKQYSSEEKIRIVLDGLRGEDSIAERAVRPVTLGRKNYLFMGSEVGGKSAAIAYTLIETSKMNKVNPDAWLAWVLERIQDHPANRMNDLMLWAYQDMINAQNAEAEAKDAA